MNSSIKNTTFTGKLITCKSCNFKFKVLEEFKQKWFDSQNPCPNCGEIFCNLTQTEKDLKNLQNIYYQNGEQRKDLESIYVNLLNYTRSICLKHFNKKVNGEEELEYHCHKAAWKFVEQYIKVRSDKLPFKIEASFAGYIVWKLRESINEKEELKISDESLDDLTFFNEQYENTNLLSFDLTVECSYLKQVEKDIFEPEIKSDISIYFDSINGELKLLVAILNYLKYGEKKSDLIFQNFGNEGRSRFLYVINQFRKRLSQGYFQ